MDRNWWRYLNVWSLPGIPASMTAPPSVILGFSFGRRHVQDQDLSSIRKLYEASRSDNWAIKELREFGIHPGEVNCRLAAYIMHEFDRHQRPAIVQWEIALAMDLVDEDWRRSRNVTAIWPPVDSGQRFSTYEVMGEMVRIIRYRQFGRPMIVAHRHHVARVYFVAKKLLGQSPLVSPYQPMHFDGHSIQPSTRDWRSWRQYELLVRAHHLLHRWV